MVNDTQPAGYAYDNVLILGSLLRNCLLRSSFTARLVREHNLVAGEIAALGSSRPLTDMEAAQLSRLRQRDYQLGEVSTEADALEAAVRHEFGLGQVIEQDCGGDDEHPGRSWRVRTYGLDGRRPLHVVSAPSGDGARRRANTADTYRFWAERVVRLQPMSTVLIVTSSIHVPFQAADALRVLALPWLPDRGGRGLSGAPLRRHARLGDRVAVPPGDQRRSALDARSLPESGQQ